MGMLLRRRTGSASRRVFRSGRRPISLLIVAAGLTLSGCHDSPAEPPPSEPPRDLVFTSNRDGDFEIVAAYMDGSGLVQLTQNTESDRYPVWSPDGKYIAFVRGEGSAAEIFVMNADGTQERNLTRSPGEDTYPLWSPDSRRIAFASLRDGYFQIYTMDVDGGNPTNVSSTSTAAGYDGNFTWSPDGRELAFHTARLSAGMIEQEIFVVSADGSRSRKLTEGPGSAGHPRWAPDGRRIAFEADWDGHRNLYIVNADGSEPTRITYGGVTQVYTSPRWSPDGSWIAFRYIRTETVFIPPGPPSTVSHNRVGVIGADGRDLRLLAEFPGPAWTLEWSPDGNWIAYDGFPEVSGAASDIWVADPRGSTATAITANSGWNQSPAWRPH